MTDAELAICPTCGGRGHGREHWDDDLGNVAVICPNCVDGKVSIEQLETHTRTIDNE